MPAMGKIIESFPRTGHAYPAEAYHLYEQFRPAMPAGQRGRGAAGEFGIDKIKGFAVQALPPSASTIDAAAAIASGGVHDRG